MKRIAIALAMAAMPAVAIAQTPGCIPQPQAAALVSFALPTLVDQLAQRCSAILPPNAYLVARHAELADRYRPDSASAWPQARRAIGTIFQKFLGQPMPPDMNSEMVRTLAEPLLGSFLAKQISRDDCFVANEAVMNTRAMSGTDVGRLAVLAIAVAGRKDKGLASVINLCKLEASGL